MSEPRFEDLPSILASMFPPQPGTQTGEGWTYTYTFDLPPARPLFCSGIEIKPCKPRIRRKFRRYRRRMIE